MARRLGDRRVPRLARPLRLQRQKLLEIEACALTGRQQTKPRELPLHQLAGTTERILRRPVNKPARKLMSTVGDLRSTLHEDTSKRRRQEPRHRPADRLGKRGHEGSRRLRSTSNATYSRQDNIPRVPHVGTGGYKLTRYALLELTHLPNVLDQRTARSIDAAVHANQTLRQLQLEIEVRLHDLAHRLRVLGNPRREDVHPTQQSLRGMPALWASVLATITAVLLVRPRLQLQGQEPEQLVNDRAKNLHGKDDPTDKRSRRLRVELQRTP